MFQALEQRSQWTNGGASFLWVGRPRGPRHV